MAGQVFRCLPASCFDARKFRILTFFAGLNLVKSGQIDNRRLADSQYGGEHTQPVATALIFRHGPVARNFSQVSSYKRKKVRKENVLASNSMNSNENKTAVVLPPRDFGS